MLTFIAERALTSEWCVELVYENNFSRDFDRKF